MCAPTTIKSPEVVVVVKILGEVSAILADATIACQRHQSLSIRKKRKNTADKIVTADTSATDK